MSANTMGWKDETGYCVASELGAVVSSIKVI